MSLRTLEIMVKGQVSKVTGQYPIILFKRKLLSLNWADRKGCPVNIEVKVIKIFLRKSSFS